MSNRIEIGDTVKVFWIAETTLIGTVRHIPQDTGDMWHVECEGGLIHVINPNCSSLKQIIRQDSK